MAIPSISCIVPFYNEAPRINTTLDILSASRYISEIICVDDGSTDKPEIDTKKYVLPVLLSKIDENQGKSAALFEGLRRAQGNIILMIDADLKDLRIEDIDAACRKILKNKHVDMLILRSTQATWITKLCRQDIVLSGTRLLKKDDLARVYENHPSRYQIETAINTFMIEQKKKVYYTEFSGFNTLRNEKIGLLRGFIGLIYLLKDVYTYRGYPAYIWQLWTFCHEELR